MRNLLYIILLEISKNISRLAIYLNLPFLTFLMCFIVLRKIKTKIKKKKNINILVLEKSHGIEDIKNLVDYKFDEDFNFLLLSRIHMHIMYDFFKKKNQAEYQNYINKVFFYFKKFLNIRLIISFNIRYNGEKILQKLTKKLDIKYLVCQKECLFNDTEINEYESYLKDSEKFKGHHITVYNSMFKKMLVESNYISADKVSVVGMPRADFFFEKKETKSSYILFLLVRPKTGLAFSKDNFSWNELGITALEEVLKFAEKNSHLNFIFKTKINNDLETLEQQKLIKKKKLKNCKIFFGGKSKDLILNAKLIISFNSTAILEALILKKKIIVPYFVDDYKKKLEKFSMDLGFSSVKKALSREELKRLLNKSCLEKESLDERTFKNDEILIDKYIGNIDGKSSKRLLNVITNLTNH